MATNRHQRSRPRKADSSRMREQEDRQAFLHYWGNTSEEEYYKLNGIRGTNGFHTSPRGLKLFTRSWLPLSPAPPKALLFMVHGYGNDISWTFQSTAIYLTQKGYACFAVDIEGHGRSDGLRAFVPNVDLFARDCLSFFNSVKQDPRFHGLPAFLFGESMGGAICLLIHLADPKGFDGAVLVAPMCKLSDNLRPRWPIPEVLTLVARFFPTLPIFPTGDLRSKSVRVEEKKAIAEMNPMRYRGKPRLGTVVELLRVTEHLGQRLREITIPFIVVHGSADVITDPTVSKALYDEANSADKTIKIYEGLMHSMLFGESDENTETVRRDICSWLDERCQ